MRKFMKKFIAGAAAAFLCLLPMQIEKISAAEYEIVFKGGSHGTVDGKDKVSYRLSTEDVFPNEPEIATEDGYVFLGWNKELPEPGTKVEGKQVYVAKYGVLVDGISYTVRYVDEAGADIATPRTMVGENGSEITERAKVVSGYTFQQPTQTFTLNKDNQEIRFVYTLTNPEEVIRYEETIEEVPVNQTVPGNQNAPATTQPQGTTPDQGQGGNEDTEVVEDQDTPQTNGEEDIDDNETPLSKGEKDNNYAMIAGIGGLAVLAAIIYLVVKKKKNNKVSEG